MRNWHDGTTRRNRYGGRRRSVTNRDESLALVEEWRMG